MVCLWPSRSTYALDTLVAVLLKKSPVELHVALSMLTACPALKEKSIVTHQVAGNYLNHSDSFVWLLDYYGFHLRKSERDFNFTRFMSDF